MKPYKSIAVPASASFVERGSEFISHIAPFSDEESVLEFIRGIKKEYSDARHNVYAYILRDNNTVRYSDDGEPHGTAGMPVLEVLKKEQLTDVAIVVTRYFGGVLLGAGGLVRAYSHSAALAVEGSRLVEYRAFTEFNTEIEYSDYSKIEALLQKYYVIRGKSDFAEKVTLTLSLETAFYKDFKENIAELTNGKALIIKNQEKYCAVEI